MTTKPFVLETEETPAETPAEEPEAEVAE